jgi:tRNA (guanine37-N1)-methyltransferase
VADPLRIDILTLFPEIFVSPLQASILKRAQENGFLEVRTHNFREFTTDRHHTADDTPFGGGAGMVLKPEPIYRAVETILDKPEGSLRHGSLPEGFQNQAARHQMLGTRFILMSPQGEPFDQRKAAELSQEKHLVMLCGRYEGFDERVREHLVTDEISIGDYVLTGGELPALVVLDAVTRLIPGVLGAEESPQEESFSEALLEYPHYTRPADFRGWKVPDVLLAGNHEQVRKWRREQSLRRTLERRPDLLEKHRLTPEDKKILARILMEPLMKDVYSE